MSGPGGSILNPGDAAGWLADLTIQPHKRREVGEWQDEEPNLFARPDWHERAACRGVGADLFFSYDYESIVEARKYCERCPVRGECAAAGQDEPEGMWAGVIHVTRVKKPNRQRADHGTVAKYVNGHCRCPECTEAHAKKDYRVIRGGRRCEECGALFESIYSIQKFCSHQCGLRARNRRRDPERRRKGAA